MEYKVKNNIGLTRLEGFGFKKYKDYYYNQEAEIKVMIESRKVIKKHNNEVFSYLMEDGLLEKI